MADSSLESWWKVLRAGPLVGVQAELDAVIGLGKAGKPFGFDDDVAGMAQRYRGNQEDIVRAKLKKRYPNAGEMPVTPINWLAFFARSDAGVYVVDAERYLDEGGLALRDADLVDKDTGEVKEKADPRAAAFKRALSDVGMLNVMPELERRALTGAQSAVLYLGWRKLGQADEGRPIGRMLWSSDCHVVCHPSAPDDENAIVALAVRQTPLASSPKIETWWVWSRTWADDADGFPVSFGPWQSMMMSTGGTATTPRMYAGRRLPFVFVRLLQADGGFWPSPERDTIVQVDELNVGRSNEQHTVDLQGHGQGVYAGTANDAEQLPMGPDRWIKVGPGEEITSIDFNPKLEDMRASRQQSLREIAVARSNNPDTYATTPSTAASGISRTIANIPHDRRIRELRPIFQRAEEKHILPILLEILALFAPESYAPKMDGAITPRVVFGSAPDYEELDQKQRRLEIDLKMGVISKAQYAVLMGHYDNESAAISDGLSGDLVEMETPTPSTAGEHAGPQPPSKPPVPPPTEE